MFGKKKKPSHSWEKAVLAGVDTATEWVAPKLGAAADVAERGYRSAAPKVQGAATSAWDAATEGASLAGDKLKEYSSAAGDSLAAQYDKLPTEAKKEIQKVVGKYDDAKDDFKKKVVPAAAGTLGGYADRTAKLIHRAEVNPRVEEALVKATGDKKIVKKLRKNSEQYAKKAAKELKKQQRSSSRKKGLLVFGLVAAGVTAGVAAWRASQPVEDPWKKPAPVTPRTTPAASPAPAAPKPAAPTSSAPKAAETNNSAKPGSEVPAPKPATD